MKKKVFLMLPCIATVAIAIFVGKKTFVSNAYETGNLLMQNVEALATGADSGGFFIPCYQSEDRKCVFNATDAAGRPCQVTVENAEKAAPYK